MKRLLNLVAGLLVVALLGGILLVFMQGTESSNPPTAPQSPPASPTAFQKPSPTPGDKVASPLPTPTQPIVQVPSCAFPMAPGLEEPTPASVTYQFSKPQVILTHTSAIAIADWLPDNQRLLITKEIRGANRQTIGIFNTRTKEESLYAERLSLISPPAWLASQKAVVFTDGTMEEGNALRLSYNPEGPVKTLQTHLASSYIAADSTGKKVAFLVQGREGHPAVMDLLERGVQLFDVELPLSSIRISESIYRITWNPRGNEVAFYNNSGLYLLNAVTGQACHLQLGLTGLGERDRRWAYFAKWSPNGRYLAMITTSGRFPLEFSELTILNTTTGTLRTIQPKRYLLSGKYYVLDIDWAPDSATIAARVALSMQEGVIYDGLYSMSARDARQERQLPELTFTGASAGFSLLWSPDGKYLVLNCPTNTEGRLCQVNVTE